MAGNEEELAKPTANAGVELDSPQSELHQAQLSEDGTEPQLAAGTENAELRLEPGERPETAAPGMPPPEGREPAMNEPAQMTEPEATAAENRDAQIGAAPSQPAAMGEPAKPRSLFPELAATAIAGALLGFGGIFALRYFEESHPYGIIPDERAASLDARIAEVEGKGAAAASASGSALAALEARVAAAESAAKAAELAALAGAEAQKAAASRPAPQEQSNLSPPAAEAQDLGPLEARIASLEQRLAPLEAEPASPKTDLRAEPERENAAANQTTRAQAVAVVAENLLRKLDHGEEFSAELTALENLAVPQATLAPLRAISASTVPTLRELTARFETLAPNIIESESATPAAENEGFIDRLARNAKGLVHYRRTGNAAAADVHGIVTRIETALADHDIEAAYKAWSELTGPASSISQGWGEAARARLDALNAATSIEAGAVAVLGKSKS